MKVLSVKQPWAYLVMAGYKDIENRSWLTNYRGPLGIHAGKSFDWEALTWLTKQAKIFECMMCVSNFGIKRNETTGKLEVTKSLDEFGALLGTVNLKDCLTSDIPIESSWAMPGSNHWVVDSPVIQEPVPMSGRLGLFEV